MVLLAELALRGEIVELDEPLFFWREHAQRATRACGSDAALATWFDPVNAGRTPFVHWTLFANYLRTIARVPIPRAQKLLCTGVMARWFLGRARSLRVEAACGVANWYQHARRRPAPAHDPNGTAQAV
jgi:hypothetical protein